MNKKKQLKSLRVDEDVHLLAVKKAFKRGMSIKGYIRYIVKKDK